MAQGDPARKLNVALLVACGDARKASRFQAGALVTVAIENPAN
jgi:hypothetical protein